MGIHLKTPVNDTSIRYLVPLALVLGLLFLLFQTRFPSCCDAEQYIGLARLYAESNISAKSTDASLRTYLYPLIVGYLIRISNFIQLPHIFIVFAFQFILYIYAVYKFVNALAFRRPQLKNAVFAAFLFNIFVYPYFSLTLTDSVYTSLVLLWFYRALKFFSVTKAGDATGSTFSLIALGMIASACFMVRPAGIWVVGLSGGMYVWAAIKCAQKVVAWRIVFAGFAAIFLPLVPQIYINLLNYGLFSPFPVFKLGTAQIQWGIENLKYATYLGGGSPQMFYQNPFYQSGSGLQWYLDHPMLGIVTLALKLVGAFDFDYLFPYIYDKSPWYQWFTGLSSMLIFLTGSWGMALHVLRPVNMELRMGPKVFPLFCFLAWASVSLVSAIELRFSLPMYSILLPFSVERLLLFSNEASIRTIWLKVFIIGVCLITLLSVARYIRAQNILLG